MTMQSESVAAVLRRIEIAARTAGRDPGSVRLVAVSKQQQALAIRNVALTGQRDFGESYTQEALPKIESLRDLKLTWHFIGRLQGNKTRDVAEQFDWVHTVDRARIADRLNEQRPASLLPLNVCIQVQVTPEPQKAGIPPEEVEPLARYIMTLPRLKLRGLMCIPPATDPKAVQQDFAALAALARDLRNLDIDCDTLSMGMSGDFEAAIAAGSTVVRVGTAIFGERH
ncbi:MAG: YggS family pyridoxal phosphate-dependent enzyme [Steroidobacteraceae bacterium]